MEGQSARVQRVTRGNTMGVTVYVMAVMTMAAWLAPDRSGVTTVAVVTVGSAGVGRGQGREMVRDEEMGSGTNRCSWGNVLWNWGCCRSEQNTYQWWVAPVAQAGSYRGVEGYPEVPCCCRSLTTGVIWQFPGRGSGPQGREKDREIGICGCQPTWPR